MTEKEIEGFKKTLILASLALQHNPVPDERARIIRLCEAEIQKITDWQAKQKKAA